MVTKEEVISQIEKFAESNPGQKRNSYLHRDLRKLLHQLEESGLYQHSPEVLQDFLSNLSTKRSLSEQIRKMNLGITSARPLQIENFEGLGPKSIEILKKIYITLQGRQFAHTS